jgi:hypothetical protein
MEFATFKEFDGFCEEHGIIFPKRTERIKLWQLGQKMEKGFEEFNKTECAKCGGYCCQSCALNEGYFLHPANFPIKVQIKAFKKWFGWDEHLGFLDTKNKRCGIPRVFRSSICVRYTCGAIRRRESKIDEIADRYYGIQRIKQRARLIY